MIKNRLQYGRPGFDPWVGKIPWRRERLPTPVFWPGEFHGITKSQTRLRDFHNETGLIKIVFVLIGTDTEKQSS